MSSADNSPSLDPEVAALLASRPSPSTMPSIQELRAGELAYNAETINYQKETAPPGMLQNMYWGAHLLTVVESC